MHFLLSRQARRVTPTDWWICAVRMAARWSAERGDRLISVHGLFPADYSAWCYRRCGGEVQHAPDAPGPRSVAFQARDRMAAEAADALIGISIRDGGLMLEIGLEYLKRGKRVLVLEPPVSERACEGNRILLASGAERLDLPLEHPCEPRHRTISPCAPSPGYLWHFTRSRSGPWPGQSFDDYCLSLFENREGAEHSAADALDRIMREQRIRACGSMIRGGRPVVCLTEAMPEELLALRRFRPALLRWDFEPHAIGIRREAAAELGIRPVSYLPSSSFKTMPPTERWLFQKHEPPKVDFRHEREWRHPGDIDLAQLNPRDVCIYSAEERSSRGRQR